MQIVESQPQTGSKPEVTPEIIVKLFAKFESVWGHSWRSRIKNDDLWESCEADWLDGLKFFNLEVLRKAVKAAILKYPTFPPTLGQFIDLCLTNSGLPLECDVAQAMMRKSFKHPVEKICYDKVGSWAITHATESDLKQKLSVAYREAIFEFLKNPEECSLKLKHYLNDEVKELLYQKPISKSDFKGWKERYAEWQSQAEEDRKSRPTILHPVYEQNQISVGHPNFDSNKSKERKNYLLTLSEKDASTLPPSDWYDRVRYFREIEAKRHLCNGGYQGSNEGENVQRGAYNARKTVFKDWMN